MTIKTGRWRQLPKTAILAALFIVVSLVGPIHIFIDSAAPGMVVHGGSRNASDMSRFKLMSQ